MRLRFLLLCEVRLLLPALVLITAACDEFPVIDAIGSEAALSR
jgi:hypothetical protein